MGSWASLRIRGRDVFHWKSEVDPTFLFLFTRDDVSYIPLADPDDDLYARPTLLVTATAGVLADRLDALGIAAEDLEGCLQYTLDEEVEHLDSMAATTAASQMVGGVEESGAHERTEAGTGEGPADDDFLRAEAIREFQEVGIELRAMTFEKWTQNVRAALQRPEQPNFTWRDYAQLRPLMDLWETFDPRWLLRAILTACDPDDELVIDLTDLELGGYLEAHEFDPQTAAAVMFGVAMLNGTPAVVITEGTTDAEFLADAIEVRRPHLASFIRFYDFGSVPGGAAVAVSTMKSLAAAGVNNRVIGLFDNDTAAREALRALRYVQLPSHYAVAHYPYLALASDYPSIGPTGPHNGDVNGFAGSIELYLGEDVLADPATGTLRPVVWGSHIPALKAYQGEVEGKTVIHAAFRAKVAAAKADPTFVDQQDWSGLDAILDRLMELLRTCGLPDPGQRGALLRTT